MEEKVSTGKTTLTAKDAMRLLENVDRLIAAKGKKLVRFNLKKDAPTRQELEKAMLGPTGKLRAPAMRRGRTLVIGFDQSAYEELFR